MSKREASSPPFCVADCAALVAISRTSSNEIRSLALEMLEDGRMKVPSAVWDELAGAYEEIAEELKPHAKHRLPFKQRTLYRRRDWQMLQTLASKKSPTEMRIGKPQA